jgi:hypothetical protein
VDIIEKLRSMDKKELGKAIKEAKAYMKTDAGKALAEKIKNGDALPREQHDAMMKAIGENPDIAKTISEFLKG